MIQDAIVRLEAGGVDVTLSKRFPSLAIELGPDRKPVPVGERVPVASKGDVVGCTLPPISQLYRGTRKPPSFAEGPTPEYMPLFMFLEKTAVDFSLATGRLERDQEMERLYRHLRRRPDGSDGNALFSYLQAAARLYMALRETSRDELDGVLRRLERSARTFGMGYSSENYLSTVSQHLP